MPLLPWKRELEQGTLSMPWKGWLFLHPGGVPANGNSWADWRGWENIQQMQKGQLCERWGE